MIWSMEKIMILVINESDAVSSDLLKVLLASIRKENEHAAPASWKLGSKVIEECTDKLEPYILKTVNSMGCCLEDYAPFLSSIYENELDSVKSCVDDSTKHVVIETPQGKKSYKGDLVGSRIKVWWPDDGRYYKGIVTSYEATKRKHWVFYDDGDAEAINLRKERWKFIGDVTPSPQPQKRRKTLAHKPKPTVNEYPDEKEDPEKHTSSTGGTESAIGTYLGPQIINVDVTDSEDEEKSTDKEEKESSSHKERTKARREEQPGSTPITVTLINQQRGLPFDREGLGRSFKSYKRWARVPDARLEEVKSEICTLVNALKANPDQFSDFTKLKTLIKEAIKSSSAVSRPLIAQQLQQLSNALPKVKKMIDLSIDQTLELQDKITAGVESAKKLDDLIDQGVKPKAEKREIEVELEQIQSTIDEDEEEVIRLLLKIEKAKILQAEREQRKKELEDQISILETEFNQTVLMSEQKIDASDDAQIKQQIIDKDLGNELSKIAGYIDIVKLL